LVELLLLAELISTDTGFSKKQFPLHFNISCNLSISVTFSEACITYAKRIVDFRVLYAKIVEVINSGVCNSLIRDDLLCHRFLIRGLSNWTFIELLIGHVRALLCIKL